MTEVVYEKANPIEGLTIKKGSSAMAVSRYLSGPTCSCHDACKYGTERAIEAKPWKTIKKKVATRERKIQVPEEDVTHFARNKKSGSSSKPSPVSKTGKSNIPVEIIKEAITSEKNPTPLEETDVSIELNNSGIREIVKNKSGYGSSSRKETATEIRSKQKRTSLIGGQEKSKLRSNRLSPKHSAKKPSTSSSKTTKNLTEESSMKTNENVEEAKQNRTGHSSQGENVKAGYKIRPKLSTIVGAATMVIPARKLTFKRGRVIELQPQSNNIARRLKFRPERLLGDDFQNNVNGTTRRIITSKEGDNTESNAANMKAEKLVYKYQTVEGSKRRTIVRKIVGDRSKIDGPKSGSEKVVLRHQIIIGEKLNPRLYNNVIEETASMLAGLRKSNVKALVGAFETVISLDSPRAEATPAVVSTPC